MAKQFNGSNNLQTLPSQMDLEFLEALLQPEDGTYPWNLADEDSEEYFLQLEHQFPLQEVLDEELTERSQAFYSQLDNLWSDVSQSTYYDCNTSPSLVAKLQESLQTSFATRVPQEWLRAIASKASEIFNTNQPIAQQLVECVQTLLPTWGADDLLVLARPYAYAMRSSEQEENAEAALNQLDEQEWTNLSEIEQARVGLAIAYQVLHEINSFQGES